MRNYQWLHTYILDMYHIHWILISSRYPSEIWTQIPDKELHTLQINSAEHDMGIYKTNFMLSIAQIIL